MLILAACLVSFANENTSVVADSCGKTQMRSEHEIIGQDKETAHASKHNP